ncbi:MAG: hypothetical protein AAGD10_12130 [Myxococcota bacterium]
MKKDFVATAPESEREATHTEPGLVDHEHASLRVLDSELPQRSPKAWFIRITTRDSVEPIVEPPLGND